MSKQIINPHLLVKAQEILNQNFNTKVEIESVELLSESERRNIVIRLVLNNSLTKVPRNLILKQALAEPSNLDDQEAFARFARDWAGLEFASRIPQSTHNVPRFYGGNKELRFILIEDLGQQHKSLVDSLTYPQPDKAILALERFMKALGSFHAASYGHTSLYESILQDIHQDRQSPQKELDYLVNELINSFQTTLATLNLTATKECITEIQSLIESLLKPGPFTVLTHGDICPDNVFDHEDSKDLQLIDFEWAFVRNALLDGTYLRMSMPTCWCAKAIPAQLIDPLEQIYREELKRSIPAAHDDLAYNKAYTEACGFWILQWAIAHIDSILLHDRIGPSGPVPKDSLWNSDENLVRPRVLSRLQTFIEQSSKNKLLPHLRQTSEQLLIELKKRWPRADLLEYYPAFMSE
ncbi:putative phosphotransferase related to Ser/Thr protein kinases [Legionella massiliensis]|uniref:Putative phosphotransferase related to Ser/Thr protein kinases n=1 Tax=Legionella massiliensis TaxID=1034943 RepID=A0A078KXJ6_9GAMM|nr:phosphotransferase [Legionella massiliensis]CDZ79135.1 putative phosphotransferase related to Ser/Thr protein kinases [Legionella massiliensis]CEE14873.1 Phosphotransferase enzyme family protein [Legionella massiliensis]